MFQDASLSKWAQRDSHVHLFLGHHELSLNVRNPIDRLQSPLLSELQEVLCKSDEEICSLFLLKCTKEETDENFISRAKESTKSVKSPLKGDVGILKDNESLFETNVAIAPCSNVNYDDDNSTAAVKKLECISHQSPTLDKGTAVPGKCSDVSATGIATTHVSSSAMDACSDINATRVVSTCMSKTASHADVSTKDDSLVDAGADNACTSCCVASTVGVAYQAAPYSCNNDVLSNEVTTLPPRITSYVSTNSLTTLVPSELVSPSLSFPNIERIIFSSHHLSLLYSIETSSVISFQMQTIHILDVYFTLLFFRMCNFLKKSTIDSKLFNDVGLVMSRLAHTKSFAMSIGLHPWYQGHDEFTLDKELELIGAVWQQECHHASIGEVGLDGRCDTDFKLQEKTFATFLNWAYEYWQDTLQVVPLSIHCVSAHNEIMPFLKDYSLRFKKALKELKSSIKRINYLNEHKMDVSEEYRKSVLLKHDKAIESYDESKLNDLGTMHFFMSSQSLALQYRKLGFRLGISGHALKPQNDLKFKKLIKSVVGPNFNDVVTCIEVETDFAGSLSDDYPQDELCAIVSQVVAWHGA